MSEKGARLGFTLCVSVTSRSNLPRFDKFSDLAKLGRAPLFLSGRLNLGTQNCGGKAVFCEPPPQNLANLLSFFGLRASFPSLESVTS